MWAFNKRFCFAFTGVLCLAGSLFVAPGVAGPLTLTGVAYNDGLGPSGGAWKGSANFAGGLGLTATVEYAVFAPGEFDDFLSEQSIVFADPTDQSHFVYAYQVLYKTGSMSINSNTVGLDGDETIGLVSSIPKALVVGSDLDPSSGANQGGNSVGWDYVVAGSAVFNAPPKESTILFFTSPHIPEYDTAALLHLGAPVPQLVASPSNITPPGGGIPEPSTVVLLLLGAAGFVQGFRSRR